MIPVFLISLSAVLICSYSYSQQDDMLNKYRWKNRVILLFADSGEDPDLEDQTTILETAGSGMQERDLVVITILPDSPRSFQALRHRIDVSESFTFVLIGKDGSEKKRSSSPVPADELFSLIDSMPMRREEMKRSDQ